jgi:hypothetical protein
MGWYVIQIKSEYENIYLEHTVLSVGEFLRMRDIVISILGPWANSPDRTCHGVLEPLHTNTEYAVP